jgi:hypothetical protein
MHGNASRNRSLRLRVLLTKLSFLIQTINQYLLTYLTWMYQKELKQLSEKSFLISYTLLDFNNKAHEMFRRWYVDGRLYYQKVIDLNQPERGMTDIRNIDALKIKPVREYKQNGPPPPNLKNTNKTYSSTSAGALVRHHNKCLLVFRNTSFIIRKE